MVLYKSLSQYILFYLFPHDQFPVLHTFIALSMVQVFLIQNNSTSCTLGSKAQLTVTVPVSPVCRRARWWTVMTKCQLVSVLESAGTVVDHLLSFLPHTFTQ